MKTGSHITYSILDHLLSFNSQQLQQPATAITSPINLHMILLHLSDPSIFFL